MVKHGHTNTATTTDHHINYRYDYLFPELNPAQRELVGNPVPPEIIGRVSRLFVTGHRPQLLESNNGIPIVGGIGRLNGYANLLLASWCQHFGKPDYVYLGMCQGFDIAMAWACVRNDVPFLACIPFDIPYHRPAGVKGREYDNLLIRAAKVLYISSGKCAAWKYIERDKYMVDRAEAGIALYNAAIESPARKTGTGTTVSYARKKDKPVFNVWPMWAKAVYRVPADTIPSPISDPAKGT